MREELERLKEKPKEFSKEFWQFVKEYSVLGLAIGVIIAQASKDLVDSIVAGFFMPIVDFLIPGEGFESFVFSVGDVEFYFGSIISSSLTFIIILVILFITVKKILKRDDLLSKKK